jgi:hypothetical protein
MCCIWESEHYERYEKNVCTIQEQPLENSVGKTKLVHGLRGNHPEFSPSLCNVRCDFSKHAKICLVFAYSFLIINQNIADFDRSARVANSEFKGRLTSTFLVVLGTAKTSEWEHVASTCKFVPRLANRSTSGSNWSSHFSRSYCSLSRHFKQVQIEQ